MTIGAQLSLGWLSERRDAHGEWTRGGPEQDPASYLQFFHGTRPETAQAIASRGLTAKEYTPYDPTLTPDAKEASLVAYEHNQDLEWPNKPASLVEVRIPKEREAEFLHPLTSHMGYRALRKPLPPEFIHAYRPTKGYTHADRVAMGGSTFSSIGGQVAELAGWESEERGPGGQWISYEHGRMRTDLLPVDKGPYPVRRLADRRYEMQDMVASIREHGVREPIAIRHNSEGTFIANGRHRAIAAKMAGVEEVPVIVQHSEGVNPRSLPLRGRRPGTVHDFQRAYRPPQGELSNIGQQVIELDWHDSWRHEARGPHGEWIKGTAAPNLRYSIPDHSRLINPRSPYPDPADHPFFKAHPVSAENILKTFDQTTPEEREQGMRWYADVHNLASAIAGGDTRLGGGLLAAYSPQANWPVNMFNASRSAMEHRALATNEGMVITGNTQKMAQKLLDGASIDEAVTGPKTNSFAHLIEHGDDDPADPYGKVVIDRHALSIAVGHRLPEDAAAPIGDPRMYDHVADEYRKAALARGISPHQMQAITWLHQQTGNQGEDRAAGETGELDTRLQRGRITSLEKAQEKWGGYTGEHPDLPIHVGTTMDQIATPITAEDVGRAIDRPVEDGGSRPVSPVEFQRLAGQGRAQLREMRKNKSAITGLDKNWGAVKDHAWQEVQQSWGGATVDAHTGMPLPQGSDKFALSVKPAGMTTVSLPENSSREAFDAAMDRARAQFRPQLEAKQSYLGIFHDDDNNRIDIDPVTVVDTVADVEQIGAYTHAIGGAYHFATGNGYFPPHVAAGAQLANEQQARWSGPGQWRSYADQVQPGLSQQQLAEIEQDEPGDDEGSGEDDAEPAIREADSFSISRQALELAAWEGEYRAPDGRWAIHAWEWPGTTGSTDHITRREAGTLPTSALAHLNGAKGETPGHSPWHRMGKEWEDFKSDVKQNGIRHPVFITVDHGQEPKISEGNHRRDAAVELGMPTTPVEISYFGHAEREGTVLERAERKLREEQGLATTISAQIELGGWRDAWRHELRGPHGEWVKGIGDQVRDSQSPWIGDKILEEENNATARKSPIAPLLRRARIAFEGDGDGKKAATLLRQAAVKGLKSGDLGQAGHDRLLDLAMSAEKHPYGSLSDNTGVQDEIRNFGVAIRKEFNKVPDGDPAAHWLNLASASMDDAQYADKLSDRPTALRDAADKLDLAANGTELTKDPGATARATKYRLMARNVRQLADRAEESSVDRQELHDFTASIADKVPGLLGGGHQAWNGKVELFGNNEKYASAELDWNGQMNFLDTLAKSMSTTLAMRNEPVSDMQPFVTVLHEMIHGTIPSGEEYYDSRDAYQDKRAANIEEGFTELGSIQHASEFFKMAGIGNRETPITAMNEYGPIEDPAYPKAVAAIVKDLQAHYVKLSSDVRAPQQHAAEKLGREIERLKHDPTVLQTDWTSGIEEAMREIQHLGDPEMSDWANKTMAGTWEWRTAGKSANGPVAKARLMHIDKKATTSEYAERLNDPTRIKNGDAWGHYAQQTARALTWVQDIAHEEGLDDLTTPEGKKRVQELSDEINRQSPEGKAHIMAEQVARLQGLKPFDAYLDSGSHSGFRHTAGIMTSNDWRELESAIMDGFEMSEASHAPLTRAKKQLATARAAREARETVQA